MKNDLYHRAAYQLKLENSLYEFTKEAWRWIDDAKYEDALHIEIICNHLQHAFERKIKRLLISIPPSFAKSLITAVMFPAWIWTQNPATQFLTGSNSNDLSTRDTVRTRDLINSEWYQYHWGSKFKFASDQNEKTYYKNDKFGHRYGFSTGARITGQRADIIILDDALNYNDRTSDGKKMAVNNLISGGLSTRFNDEKTGVMIIIGQRLCKDDPIGHLLEKKIGWEYLNLPLEANSAQACKTSIFVDTRRDGECLWPSRWDVETINAKKLEVGSHDFATQYNQQPIDLSSSIFKLDNCETYRQTPNFIQIIDSWDTAFGTKEQNDYSVCSTWGYTKNMHYLLNVWRGKVKFPELKKKMIEIHDKFSSNLILVEAKATGTPVVDELKATTRLPLKLINPLKDKILRAHAAAPAIEGGKVVLPERASWLFDWKEEHEAFPNSKNDDQVDSTTQYLVYMIKPRSYDRLFSMI